ncbi:DUF1799 domain-containing protein [Parvibaculaceae bacterium PLY_AMNH_Bact1]|nr:DUF1799 domain-containing protein [Parvibaculaceae bacterium PLY_AMNH_Bact1]
MRQRICTLPSGAPRKKLKEAARAIALGKSGREGDTRGRFGADVAEQLVAFGAPAHIVALASEKPAASFSGEDDGTGEGGENVFVVEAANQEALSLFIHSETQWRYVSLTTLARAELIRTGLDYAALEAAAHGLGLEWSDGLVSGIHTMERETLAVEAEQRRKRGG